MANLNITNTFVPNTTILSAAMNTNFSDVEDYINNRNDGTTAWDNVESVAGIQVQATTNQLVLGTTRTVTVSAPTPATTSRTWTIPDITADGTFASLTGTQTFSGSKTFSSSLLADGGIFGSSAVSGSTLAFEVRNTSNTASSDAALRATSGGTSAGDAYGRFTVIGGGDYYAGVDNSVANDPFVIGSGSTPGTLDGLVMTGSSGAVAIRGTATNDNATTGFVGESVRSLDSSFGNVAATTQFIDLTSISLTAGDWLVTGVFAFTLAGATSTQIAAAISVNSGNTTTDHVQGDNLSFSNPPTAALDQNICIANYRLSISATTTVYLKARADYSAGTPQAKGRISALRIR